MVRSSEPTNCVASFFISPSVKSASDTEYLRGRVKWPVPYEMLLGDGVMYVSWENAGSKADTNIAARHSSFFMQ